MADVRARRALSGAVDVDAMRRLVQVRRAIGAPAAERPRGDAHERGGSRGDVRRVTEASGVGDDGCDVHKG